MDKINIITLCFIGKPCWVEFVSLKLIEIHFRLITELKEDEYSSLKRAISKGSFKCGICGKCYKTREKCRRHIKRIHLNSRNEPSNMGDYSLEEWNKNKHEVIESQEPMDTGDYSLEQWNEMVASKSKECPVCHKTFETGLMGVVTRDEWEILLRDKVRICPKCNKEFYSDRTMRRHLKQVHVEIKTFSCEECDKIFATKKDVSKSLDSQLCNLRFESE
ncbi:hypothetical protein M8J76_006149 [Diaphorina citri]|nr:hypothetical protein M8J75_016102 [Diaphorina citri]KAI5749286.1 hypothetical protein M8J76_006149 [Diaphorina citri]KAI5753513.1 hypothetical protein M8J77_000917 [Diaphorina citri]